jgi:signal transduction histidine kinase
MKQTVNTLASSALFITVFLVSDVFSFGLIFELLDGRLSELSIQLIASCCSLLLTVVILTLTRFSLFVRYRNAFARASEVIDKLSRGDFEVAPRQDFRIDPKLGRFVRSIDEMAAELAKVEAMRHEFVSNVSHEIQSPLTSIRGYAIALEDERITPAERREYLGVIQAESERLSGLSESLLRLAALDAHGAVDETRVFRLDQQLRNAIIATEPQWSAKGIDLEADLAETTIRADADLLGQVWLNLLGNAVKFTPPGGQIQVSLSDHDGTAVCEIADTGIGIADDALPHIFERFYKADQSRSAFAGSGLGLAITKKIIDLCAGKITVESELGKGATILVSLPISMPAQSLPQPASQDAISQ